MLKKFGIATYLALATFILTIISWILYGVSVSAAGYFHQVPVAFVVLFTIFALLCLLLAIAISFIPKKGALEKILPIVQSILLIGASVFLISTALNIIGSRAEGFGYIFFSDANLAGEVKTADNLHSASLSITTFIFYLVTWLVSVITPFFSLTKKPEQVSE